MGFKVIIVGGSVSGLSLASMLEKFDIDYILLEGHTTIAPQLGASLGLLPTGLRILDQLGCYDKIREIVGNTYYGAQMRLFSGKTWVDTKPITFSEKLEERIGYPQTFVDRQAVIQVLFDSLKYKDRVLTSKRVHVVEHGEDHVTVHTKDGSKYTGDIVVGADGIHSTVRQEMWRIARDAKSDIFQLDPLADLHEHREQTSLVSIEDHVFPRWHYRRIITIGDAAHKLHPISAQGGNGAMETAAVLVNRLVATLQDQDAKESLTECDIDEIFADVQTKRFQRAVDAVNQGRQTNSASIKETFFSKIFVDYFFPRFGQSLIFSLIVKNTTSAPYIARLPLPPRYTIAIERHQKRNPKRNWTAWSFMSLGVGVIVIFMYARFRAASLHGTDL
ncbi:hypothetical protein FSHL1_012528 [Fusarium sambucinum]